MGPAIKGKLWLYSTEVSASPKHNTLSSIFHEYLAREVETFLFLPKNAIFLLWR